ncbi:Hypothetical Protein FCC1311_083112 [Hondaea fermentalgiana]|uniref:Uncharacterized protein n=1 Tax=Hondaea fermentalgiana TaxID=2315210 RepID=A0A2R5GMI1_9STRA|nr:Hypothetical Protein FCC1311_083112 [Hondaea fermentalgiana]|eukprot:GBG32086.1 Hypothetical Protein FCC1311_083112 [Hondaea fermentalgiana]
MWNSEADKYWKEKEKTKRRAALQRKLIIAASVLAIIVVTYIGYSVRAWMLAPVPEIKNTTVPKEIVIPNEVLQTCRSECRANMIDFCNSECRFAHQEMPRPTIFRACQSPCIKVAQATCDYATSEKALLRRQCRNSGETVAFQECRAYENHLPRPRIQQVCKVGSKSSVTYTCTEAAKCINRQMDTLKVAHEL